MNSVHEPGSRTMSKNPTQEKYRVKSGQKQAECTECTALGQAVCPLGSARPCAPCARAPAARLLLPARPAGARAVPARPACVPCAPSVPSCLATIQYFVLQPNSSQTSCNTPSVLQYKILPSLPPLPQYALLYCDTTSLHLASPSCNTICIATQKPLNQPALQAL